MIRKYHPPGRRGRGSLCHLDGAAKRQARRPGQAHRRTGALPLFHQDFRVRHRRGQHPQHRHRLTCFRMKRRVFVSVGSKAQTGISPAPLWSSRDLALQETFLADSKPPQAFAGGPAPGTPSCLCHLLRSGSQSGGPPFPAQNRGGHSRQAGHQRGRAEPGEGMRRRRPKPASPAPGPISSFSKRGPGEKTSKWPRRRWPGRRRGSRRPGSKSNVYGPSPHGRGNSPDQHPAGGIRPERRAGPTPHAGGQFRQDARTGGHR